MYPDIRDITCRDAMCNWSDTYNINLKKLDKHNIHILSCIRKIDFGVKLNTF